MKPQEFTKTAVEPKVRKLKEGWKYYSGDEVKNSKGSKILSKFNDIKKDTIVTIKDCFGNIRKAKCNSKKKYTYAYDTKLDYASYTLEFNIDDRHCWVCTSTNHISKEAMKMLEG